MGFAVKWTTWQEEKAMRKVSRTDFRKDYAKFGLWFVFVTVVFISGYWWAVYPVWSALATKLLGIDPVSMGLPKTLVEFALPSIAGVLLWWRTVKVFVLHGAPFCVGLTLSDGRQDDGKTGRRVVCPHIGDPRDHEGSPGLLMFGVLIAHASSDKLVRYRLDTLSLAMPRNRSLLIRDSRFFWQETTALQRATQYKGVTDRYYRKVAITSEEMFRSTVVQGMRVLRDGLPRLRQNLDDDGLHWATYPSGDGVVMDDLGNGLIYKQAGLDETDIPMKTPLNTEYFVTELGVRNGTGTMVSSWDELRDLVNEKLKPGYRVDPALRQSST